MKPPRMRAWHLETKMMHSPEEIFTRENIYMLLNSTDYVWMRSTENIDKHGNEIFEGDILKNIDCFGNEEIHKVAFEYAEAWDCVDCGVEPHSISGLSLGAAFFNTYKRGDGKIIESRTEVLGNIYENPELMERKNVDEK